jgi:hypothetical protein
MDPSFAPESAGEQSELYGPSVVDDDNNACLHDGVLGAQAIAEFAIENVGRRTDQEMSRRPSAPRWWRPPGWERRFRLANRWGIAAASATREKTTGAPLS